RYATLLSLHSFPTRRSSDLERGQRCKGAVAIAQQHSASEIVEVDSEQIQLAVDVEVCRGYENEASRSHGDRTLGSEGAITIAQEDRKSTRLNSSHVSISYAV